MGLPSPSTKLHTLPTVASHLNSRSGSDDGVTHFPSAPRTTQRCCSIASPSHNTSRYHPPSRHHCSHAPNTNAKTSDRQIISLPFHSAASDGIGELSDARELVLITFRNVGELISVPLWLAQLSRHFLGCFVGVTALSVCRDGALISHGIEIPVISSQVKV
jgi:hypothetical protein